MTTFTLRYVVHGIFLTPKEMEAVADELACEFGVPCEIYVLPDSITWLMETGELDDPLDAERRLNLVARRAVERQYPEVRRLSSWMQRDPEVRS